MQKLHLAVIGAFALASAAAAAIADDRAHLDAALAAIDAGDIATATAEAKLVGEADPWRADAQFALAWCHAASGDSENAVVAYREVVRLRPADAKAWNNLGTTLDEMGHLEEAVEAYDHAIAVKADYSAAMNNRGVSLEKLGETLKAAAMFRQAIQLDPAFAAAHNNLGACLYELGDRKAAQTEWTEAARLDPTYVSPIVNNSVLDFEGQRESVAEAKLKVLVDDGRATAEVWFNLGIFAFHRGDHEQAMRYMEQADRLRPDDPETLNNLGVVYCYRGNYRRAEQALRQALAKKQDWAKAWDNLGLTLYRMERFKDAREAFQKEAAIAPTLSSAHYNMGCAFAAEGDSPAAEKAFEKAIEVSPVNVEAMHNLALLLSDRKDRDPARELALFERAVSVDPQFAAAHLSLGAFYQSEPKYQDPRKAIYHYEQYVMWQKGEKDKVDEVMRTVASLRATLAQ
jgi:Flp pilus assembly protein TadD